MKLRRFTIDSKAFQRSLINYEEARTMYWFAKVIATLNNKNNCSEKFCETHYSLLRQSIQKFELRRLQKAA